MIFRVVLLFGISVLISLSKPFMHYESSWLSAAFTGQSVILIIGGLFLLYKATSEIHHKLEGSSNEDEETTGSPVKASISGVVAQIAIINVVFSIDSILTAVRAKREGVI
jgi:predicted tellurium resistance membrane protein TerC